MLSIPRRLRYVVNCVTFAGIQVKAIDKEMFRIYNIAFFYFSRRFYEFNIFTRKYIKKCVFH